MVINFKKFLFRSFLVLGLISLSAAYSHASTYYVRLDGGDARECSGSVNAPYSGSGTGQPCAFSHPRYALGWGCTNTGNACANAGVMHGGDTLYIDGDDPTNNGVQAQYEIGYDDTNSGLTPGCSSSYPYDCTLGNLPAGIDTTQRTSIIGTGTHRPQLWGTQRVWQVLNADNNHLWLQWLEITDHANCAYNSPDQGCNYSGPSYGQWGEDGLFVGGDDVNVTDVYIHGLGRYGINTDNFGNATFTRLKVIGNGYAGVSTGIYATIAGTIMFNQPIIEWNGCVESYPLKSLTPTDNPSNFSSCFGQNQNGYGDGLAFGNVGHGGAGNWTIDGPGSISFNTQDGLDTLHGNGNGTIQIDKMRFEGNAGNQVKMNALTSILTNSIVIGDCGWWLGSPQASAGFQGGDICRALGDTILFNVTNSSQTFLYNNTIVSNGNVALESEDLNGTGCNGSTSINALNNIVLGGYAWIDDTSWNSSGGNSQTTYTYNDGNDGNGSGTCGSIKWNEDYNIVEGTKNGNQGCNGSHDLCSTNPGLLNNIPMGTAGGGMSSYYQGNSAASLVSLNRSSAAIASGVSGLVFWNDGNDYHNVTRTSPPSRGGLEQNSCAANSYGCSFNSDCCSGSCLNYVCGQTSNSAPVTIPINTGNNSSSTGSNVLPTVSLTSPSNGSSFTNPVNITFSATASEAGGSISQVAFYSNGSNLLGTASTPPYEIIDTNLPAGNYSITAVATDANGNTNTSTPSTITVTAPLNVNPAATPMVLVTNPTSGSSYTAGSNMTINASASESNGSIAKVDFYENGSLLGTSNASPYSFVFTNAPVGNYNITAMATDATGVTATSIPVSVIVTAPINPGPQNINPVVVAVTSPASNANFTIPSNIVLKASVTGNSASIARVDYYAGTIYLGEAINNPYSVAWNCSQAGTYNISAKATDTNGVIYYSAPVTIMVNTHQAPSVNILTPANNATFTAGTNISLTANATAQGGVITKVDFYNGNSYLGTDYNDPYAVNLNSATAGNYNITAKATDSYGWSSISTGVNFTVTQATAATPVDNSTSSAPTSSSLTTVPIVNVSSVSITSPLNNSSYTIPAGILLTASASDGNDPIARVDYYAGQIYLGESKNSPYAVTWNSAQAGTYSITAKATDNKGIPHYSSAVNITVNAHSAPTVSLVSPLNNGSFNEPANLTLTANAVAGGGTITKVDFYNGSIYLGTAYQSPFTYNWNNVYSGSYSLSAKATDSYGWSATSSSVNIIVNSPYSNPIIPPAPNQTTNIPTPVLPTSPNLTNNSTDIITPAAVMPSTDVTNEVLTSSDSNANAISAFSSEASDSSKVLTSDGSSNSNSSVD